MEWLFFWHYKLGVGVTTGFIFVGVFLYLCYAKRKEAEADAVPTVYEEAVNVVQDVTP